MPRPASAARWARMLEPRLLGGALANLSASAGVVTTAPIRRPAIPSHFEKL